MPEFSVLLMFAAASLALTLTPGPDMLLIASRSVAQGRTAGFLTYFGIAAGCYVHAVLAGLGLAQVFEVVPVAYDVVRYAGAAYLLYLAWKTLFSKATALNPNGNIARISKRRIFSEGLMTNLLNPKVALFVLALLPQFVDPAQGSVLVQMLVLATLLNLIGLGVNGSVVMLSDRLGGAAAKSARFQALSNYLLATVFGGLALRLAWSSKD
ncbi:LysE family translocator [Flexibacterium corallicola]|uniref:LysE family translocator n=1 Tax=Flexibacterium corallicola TaxID=3037259 RepID=UPI00286FA9F6|nr:LysE family translocator [Pseudovibrio sp. M1P-2-3]